MQKTLTSKPSGWTLFWNKLRTFLSKPQNTILVVMAVICTLTTFAPIIAILEDTLKIHPGTIDAHLTGLTEGYSFVNYIDLFTGNVAKTNLWTPLLNTVILAVFACVVSILYGGIFAFLVTRTNLKFKKYG